MTNTTEGGWTPAREAKDLSASGLSGKIAKVSAVLPEKHNSDTNELFRGAETILIKASARFLHVGSA